MKYLIGSCLCKKIKIQVADTFIFMGNCHCSECRKFTGSAFSSVASVELDQFKILEGEEFLSTYHKSEETDLGFCSKCGSSLYSKKKTGKKYNIRLGILDDVPTQRATFHVFVGSKAPWHDITDELKQFDKRP